jgi:hypothetical protein
MKQSHIDTAIGMSAKLKSQLDNFKNHFEPVSKISDEIFATFNLKFTNFNSSNDTKAFAELKKNHTAIKKIIKPDGVQKKLHSFKETLAKLEELYQEGAQNDLVVKDLQTNISTIKSSISELEPSLNSLLEQYHNIDLDFNIAKTKHDQVKVELEANSLCSRTEKLCKAYDKFYITITNENGDTNTISSSPAILNLKQQAATMAPTFAKFAELNIKPEKSVSSTPSIE